MVKLLNTIKARQRVAYDNASRLSQQFHNIVLKQALG